MKLNLGCGFSRPDGFIHVDLYKECNPDVVHDLEVFPWPFESNTVQEILMNHSLEHLGHKPDTFLSIMKELYRVCENNAKIQINVPHPRHDHFIADPTHVRAITPLTLELFDLELNKHWQKINAANSPFAIYLGVNFKLISTQITLEQDYLDKFQAKKISNGELMNLLKERNNVASEYRFTLKVIK
jgi:hypothetical protein